MLQVVFYIYGFCWLAGYCNGMGSFGSGDMDLVDSSLLEAISSSIEMAMASQFIVSSTTSLKIASTDSLLIASSIPSSIIPSSSLNLSSTTTLSLSYFTSTSRTVTVDTSSFISTTVYTKEATLVTSLSTSANDVRITSTTTLSSPISSSSDMFSFTPLPTYSLTIINPSTTYSVSSQPSPSVTPSVYPSIPTMIMIASLNSTSISITWHPVIGVSGYMIYIVRGPDQLMAKRQTQDQMSLFVDGSDITMYIVTGLSPGSSYGIQIASVIGVMEGERSEILWIVTDEDTPGPPTNVTWIDIGGSQLNVSWLPPLLPNGEITSYIVSVTLHSAGSTSIYNVSSLFIVIPKPDTINFSIMVSAINGAGTSAFVNATMTEVIDETPSTLSAGSVAGIVIVCILLIVTTVVCIVVVVIFLWRRHEHGVDDNIGEMEYKTVHINDTPSVVDTNSDGDSQLTAKRWMRANANYSTPSALLPSIAELVSRYSTAEDVVSTKTISRPQVNGLSPLLETHTVPPESINSSSERSQEAPSTLSSVCSKGHAEVHKVVSPHEMEFSEREAGMRESELVDGNQPLFEMMENVYVPLSLDESCIQEYLIEPSSIDTKERMGLGEHSKVMVARDNRTDEDNLVAVKILKEEASKDDFIGAAYILGQFSHRNIVELLGFTISPLMMVITLMELSDLKSYLVRVRRRTRLEHQPCSFNTVDQLNISTQIACGMEYLSSKFYTHKSLQSKYVLLDEDFNVKISGFHMSRVLGNPEKFQELKKLDKLPTKWFALETLTNEKFTPYTDIWSFGVVLWEIFSFGLTPYRGVLNSDVVNHLLNGERLNKPSDCPDDIYTLMLHCWNIKCRERPSFNQLHTHLSNILESTKSRQNELQNSSEFNIFDYSGVTLPSLDDSSTNQVDPSSTANDHLQNSYSNTELEMQQVVLRNHVQSTPTITPNITPTDEEARNSNHSAVSSIPELVLSAQPRDSVDIVHSIIGSNNQLMSTEEYTVL